MNCRRCGTSSDGLYCDECLTDHCTECDGYGFHVRGCPEREPDPMDYEVPDHD